MGGKAGDNTVAIANAIGVEFEEVAEITLAEIFERNRLDSIDLLHMDVQGAEFGLYEEVDKMVT